VDERPPPDRPAVTLFVHDLAGNPIVRAAPLAAALSPHFRVELVGLLLSGPAVYAPYRGRFDVRALRCAPHLPAILAAAPRLARLATGDVLYACKPLFSTLLPAVLAARQHRRPVLLDVEDDERSASTLDAPARGLRGLLRRAADTHALQARLAHPLVRSAAAVTVSTRALRARYGGTLLRHGPDEAAFDPARPELADRAALRARFGLPVDRKLALFAGRPRPHKGWEVLVDALLRPEAAGWELVAAGPATPAHAAAAEALGPRFHALGVVANEEMPALLAACDAAPAPQLDEPYARAQLPAKVLEAMAMARPVVASSVGDLPEILGGGERGWLVPPGDAPALARALAGIAADAEGAARRGEAARRWFVAEAGVGALRARLLPIVRAALDAGRAA
jgi:glycosyltransferase involved in cell wall biosynthesis